MYFLAISRSKQQIRIYDSRSGQAEYYPGNSIRLSFQEKVNSGWIDENKVISMYETATSNPEYKITKELIVWYIPQ